MSADVTLKKSESLQIFEPHSKPISQPFIRPSSSQKSLQGLGIKGLINAIQSSARPTPSRQSKRPKSNVITTTMPEEYLVELSKQLVYASLNSQGGAPPKTSTDLSLREKRLLDIEKYRSSRGGDSSRGGSQSNQVNLTDVPSKRPSSGVRAVSVSSVKRRRNVRHTQFAGQPNQSSGFFFEPGSVKEHETPGQSMDQSTQLLYKTMSNHQFPRGFTPIKEDISGTERKGVDPNMIHVNLLVDSRQEPITPIPCRTRPRRSVSTGLLRRRGQGPLHINSEQKPSSAMSIESFSKGHFFGHQESLNDSPTLDSPTKVESLKDDPRFQRTLAQYEKKAVGPMPRLKIKTQFKQRPETSSGVTRAVDEERKKLHASMLQSMNPVHSNFITEKFNEDMMDRMGTFYAFGFTRAEKKESQEINNFFDDVNQGKNMAGTMGTIDLWSIGMRSEVANKAKFAKEKNMLEKFSFNTSKTKKVPSGVKGENLLQKANDNMDKHKLAMRELTISAARNQDLALVSPMIRHKTLRGKTFYDPKEATVEAKQTFMNLNMINQRMGALFDNINQFSEQNQEDYQKLLHFKVEKKKREKMKGYDAKKEIKKIKAQLPTTQLGTRSLG